MCLCVSVSSPVTFEDMNESQDLSITPNRLVASRRLGRVTHPLKKDCSKKRAMIGGVMGVWGQCHVMQFCLYACYKTLVCRKAPEGVVASSTQWDLVRS